MSYPEDWGMNEIHYHETAEVLCTYCFKYCHEQNIERDSDNCDICPDCAEEHKCHWCGTITRNPLPYAGHIACIECKEILVKEENL